MKNRIVITVNDYHKLMGLMEFASMTVKPPEIADRLYRKICGAKMVRQESIDKKTITMNSRVSLRELNGSRETEITITYPKDAEPRERRVSIFSEIGLALYGRKEKEVVSWKVPREVGFFEIVKVTYQPEAAGHYHL